jgi:uncharacterized C2H2 Zn-finger protein
VIELSFGMMLTLFAGVPLLVIAVLSLIYNFRTLHRSSRDKENIYECAECGHVYTFARNRPMDRCPRCDHLNDAVRT